MITKVYSSQQKMIRILLGMISRGKLNKDTLLKMNVGGKKEMIYYQSAPCSVCSEPTCSYLLQ